MTGGPRPLRDPRPVVYLGAPASFAFGFASVAALIAAIVMAARRFGWIPGDTQ